jgi:hypothetical protein
VTDPPLLLDGCRGGEKRGLSLLFEEALDRGGMARLLEKKPHALARVYTGYFSAPELCDDG